MTTAIVTRRNYLDDHRRAIIVRSIAGAMLGALPIPFVDDWAIGKVLGRGYKAIADAHGVDIDDDALMMLVHGASKPPTILDVATGGILLRIASRTAKRMMVVLATANRARAASRTYVTMTLFEHYCARLHTGAAIDSATAKALREDIERTIDNTPGALAFQPFRRGALAAARASLRAPLELADLATRGAVRRLLRARNDEVTHAEAVDELDRTIETAIASKTSFLGRAAAAIEVQLSSDGNPYLDSAIDNLDRRWRARTAAGVTPPPPDHDD